MRVWLRKTTLTKLSIYNTVLLIAISLVQSYLGEKTFGSMLLTYTPQHWLGIPAIPLLLSSLFRQQWKPLAINILAFGFFVLVLMNYRINLSGQPDPRVRPLRVMTYNMLVELRGVQNVVKTIHDQNPDIVCLQECAANGWDPDGTASPELRAGLKGYDIQTHNQILIAVRHPLKIVNKRVHPMPFSPERRALLDCEVDLGGTRIRVINLHLIPISYSETMVRHSYFSQSDMSDAARNRRAQIQELISVVDRTQGRLIVCGDFNMPAKGWLYRKLTSRLTDSFAETGLGLGYTCPDDIPTRRIDHILVRGFTPLKACVPVSHASDHRPMVATVYPGQKS
ncbi:MAG: endonuclease/exonuclease/phosphatase family protein [Armatimonadota bacterium]